SALARLGRDADPEVLQVAGGEPARLDRGAAGAEGVELAQLARVVADEDLSLRLVLAQRRAVAGLVNLVGDVLAGLDQGAQPVGRVEGHRLEPLSNHQVAHGEWLRPPGDRSCTATRLAARSSGRAESREPSRA